MRNYKHILEAINHGIQFALDDFEPEEDLDVKAKDKVINKEDSLWQNLKIREKFIDLGLPSGTWWAKTNIGADCGDYPESWYGDYLAWGEIEPKDSYNSENYKFFENNKNS